ncbi:hypothetical protein NC652_010883 [Populus alba x Populus x berolinensis]|uniref:Uncharacterized protein n=1 Tax=Populus alba x Populus x berolinensis TaxID=444605 RepID=A0AAD6R0T7_9ROSI|nr:hypothetical protein NC652_010442 [Populus alba x Populus x berolinensis]KAJ6935976.1 hypothetical protein NC652_010877 [Populus alba x Populus x berolinensis]KAJ6935983.1 hypothetical protein NC652_010883 [Populus alba x Populus x berolinensis]KAJ7000283.1 hypothetical protein NC653_010917 [Populus alba x Populus x berolinensis]KAJ7000290.1 hypothetical protein NC653_010924 [Populus alba x Populus x berolinensis]
MVKKQEASSKNDMYCSSGTISLAKQEIFRVSPLLSMAQLSGTSLSGLYCQGHHSFVVPTPLFPIDFLLNLEERSCWLTSSLTYRRNWIQNGNPSFLFNRIMSSASSINTLAQVSYLINIMRSCTRLYTS